MKNKMAAINLIYGSDCIMWGFYLQSNKSTILSDESKKKTERAKISNLFITIIKLRFLFFVSLSQILQSVLKF